MAKIQCKMCGGELNLPENVFSGECPYCGTLTTFPKISSDELENLYNRAEHLRRINEYDKAVAAYEKIVEANPEDAEAYWGLVISRFGIEYVEDPVSHERIPTCHRVQYESILADPDYLTALEKAASYEKNLYEAEAKRIAEIQKGILSISNNEQPFDVFICYKESDNYGRRTRDSVTAQEIYYQLNNAGYKVFFARITLENKLGQQYEPYIFAALNSAKVMLVIGSAKEYFDAVWVRNEWSRFLAMMKKDRSKLLIPCYKDMDAYDIPEELSMLQAQDMSKIGFIQDLLHGIKKVVNKQESATAQAPAAASAASSGKNNPLLRRVKLFLEHDDFNSAKEYCEKTLDQEPENGWAYFYRLMAELKIADPNKITTFNFQNIRSYQLARQFADGELAAMLAKFEEDQQNARANLILQGVRQQAAFFNNLMQRENSQPLKRIDVIQSLQRCIAMTTRADLGLPGNIEHFHTSMQNEKAILLSKRQYFEIPQLLQGIDECLRLTQPQIHIPQKTQPPAQLAKPLRKYTPDSILNRCENALEKHMVSAAQEGCGTAILLVTALVIFCSCSAV